MTDHPRDEFDRVPEASVRQGVHRERLVPAGSGGLGLKIMVGVLALLIGLGAYFLLPRLGLTGAGDGATAGLSTSTPSAATTQDDEPSSDATGPGGPGTDGPDMDATSTADAGDPDRNQTINVLNGTGSPGLASVAAARLASEGWTSVLPGNWAGVQLETSAVFYDGEEQRPAAEAVAADLGISTVTDSPGISPYISAVLGPEFQ